MGQAVSRNQRILMAMQEKMTSMLEFAERVNIIMEECIEAEASNDKEAERRIVAEIDKMDEEMDDLITNVAEKEMDEMAQSLGEEALERNVAWLKECRQRIDELVDAYEAAMHEEHDPRHAAQLRQQIKRLGHDLVRGR